MISKKTSDIIIKYEDMEKLAKASGFTTVGALNMDALIFRSDVRDMCASGKCNNYGKSWSCPPATPSLENITNRASAYGKGIILQTTAVLEDEFDTDGITELGRRHQKSFDNFVRQASMIYGNILPMGTGGCRRCKKCTYPDRPCRYPDKLYHSMEAYGLWVSDVCEKSDVKYYYGPKTMTFTACVLYELCV